MFTEIQSFGSEPSLESLDFNLYNVAKKSSAITTMDGFESPSQQRPPPRWPQLRLFCWTGITLSLYSNRSLYG